MPALLLVIGAVLGAIACWLYDRSNIGLPPLVRRERRVWGVPTAFVVRREYDSGRVEYIARPRGEDDDPREVIVRVRPWRDERAARQRAVGAAQAMVRRPAPPPWVPHRFPEM